MLSDARSRVGCVRQVSQRVINGVRALEEDAMGFGNEWQKSDGVLREGDCVYMGGVRCAVGDGRGGRFCDCWLQACCSVRRGHEGRSYGRALRHAVCRANEQATCAAGGSGCEGVTGQAGRSCA